MVRLPAETPVTTPPVPIVAMAVLLLLQVPPAVASERVIVEPVQTPVDPVMAPTVGRALTEITCPATAVPQTVVTV